jgi:GDP-L-fucose synthase
MGNSAGSNRTYDENLEMEKEINNRLTLSSTFPVHSYSSPVTIPIPNNKEDMHNNTPTSFEPSSPPSSFLQHNNISFPKETTKCRKSRKIIVTVNGSHERIGIALQTILNSSTYSSFYERYEQRYEKRYEKRYEQRYELDDEFLFTSSSELDLLDGNAVHNFFDHHKPDAILHLSFFENFENFENFEKNKVSVLEHNVIMNTNVLRVAHLCDIQRVVSLLCIDLIDSDCTPYYKQTSRLLEMQSRAYHEEYNRDYCCIFSPPVYGVGGKQNQRVNEMKHIISPFWLSRYETSPSSTIRFLYSHDVARLVLWSLHNYYDKEPFILPEQESVSFSDMKVAYDFNDEYHDNDQNNDNLKKKEVQFSPTYQAKVIHEKFRNLLPEFSFTTLEEGMSQIFQKNY